MKRAGSIAALAVLLMWAAPAGAADTGFSEQGILIYALPLDGGKRAGEPGQLVRYRHRKDKPRRIDIEIEGEIYESWSGSWAVPLEIAPSRIFVELVGNRSSDPTSWKSEELAARHRLAVNATRQFPSHPLSEELLHLRCSAAADLERFETDGKSSPLTVGCLNDYMKRFPNGRHADENRWTLFQYQTLPYEFEGNVEVIRGTAAAFERFLEQHQGSSVREEILFEIAYLYRVAAESAAAAEARVAPEEEIRAWIARARAIYGGLLESANPAAREKARVALYNLDHGRRTYHNANEY